MTKEQLYDEAMDKWKITGQSLVLAEECAELTKATSKLARYAKTASGDEFSAMSENFIEEVADVQIMIEQIMQFYGFKADDVEDVKNLKLKRLAKRMEVEYDAD